jgi:hypothetical protein
MQNNKTTTPAATPNPRTVLVKVDSVMDVRGVSADVVYDMADGGCSTGAEAGLQWVWNLAVDAAGEIRNLRFWSREVITPETTRNLNLETVIALILGDRKQFHAGEVCQLLRVRRPTLINLRDQLCGHLGADGAAFPRAGLHNFLTARWLGYGASKKPTTAFPPPLARPGGNKSLLPRREARRIDFKTVCTPRKP